MLLTSIHLTNKNGIIAQCINYCINLIFYSSPASFHWFEFSVFQQEASSWKSHSLHELRHFDATTKRLVCNSSTNVPGMVFSIFNINYFVVHGIISCWTSTIYLLFSTGYHLCMLLEGFQADKNQVRWDVEKSLFALQEKKNT